jgi:hypothetical protein
MPRAQVLERIMHQAHSTSILRKKQAIVALAHKSWDAAGRCYATASLLSMHALSSDVGYRSRSDARLDGGKREFYTGSGGIRSLSLMV